MGIQPIDLQTMYSQLSNVSKVIGGQQQTAQISEYSQQQVNAQKNLENSTKVQQTSNEKTKASANKTVNQDGSSGGGAFMSSGKKKNEQNETYDETASTQSRKDNESHLGNLIDIMQ